MCHNYNMSMDLQWIFIAYLTKDYVNRLSSASIHKVLVNSYCDETGIIWENYVNTITADALAPCAINTLRPTQNGCHLADAIFKCIFMNENAWISIKISLKFLPKGLSNNIPAMVQIMAWRWTGDKPLSEPMMVNLLMHICITQSRWVKPSAAIVSTLQDQRPLVFNEEQSQLPVPSQCWDLGNDKTMKIYLKQGSC